MSDVWTTYNLNNPPWFLAIPTNEETKQFEASLSKAVLNDFFAILRKHPNLSHHAVVAPKLGGITAGEMALVYLRAQITTRRRRKKLKTEQVDASHPPKKKPCPLWATLHE